MNKEVTNMKKVTLLIVCAVMLLLAVPMNALAGANCKYPYESPVQHSADGRHFYRHRFSGNRCIICGYVKEGRDTYNNMNLNTLRKLGDDIKLNSCWVMYDTPVYSDSSVRSRQWSWLQGDITIDYYVGNYQVYGDEMWVELIERAYDGAPVIGWVNAENLYIDPNHHPLPESGPFPSVIRVTASSARVRADAGAEYTWITTVKHGDRFNVLDAKVGTNGNGWYKIKVGGYEGWIAAGLTEILAY